MMLMEDSKEYPYNLKHLYDLTVEQIAVMCVTAVVNHQEIILIHVICPTIY